jgi:hypothetical protein
MILLEHPSKIKTPLLLYMSFRNHEFEHYDYIYQKCHFRETMGNAGQAEWIYRA